MKNAPTEEQQAILDAARDTPLLKIEAMAGTGKTTTLEMASYQHGGKGLYLAFNKAIAQEAKSRFSRHVECRTFHSLAFATMGPKVAHRLEGKENGTLNPIRIKELLGLKDLPPIKSMTRASLVRETYNQFLYSPDPCVSSEHLPDAAMAQVLLTHPLSMADQASLCETIAQDAQRLWELVWAPDSRAPVSHDTYLKAYGLSAPSLPYDYIEVDEAQDMNPNMLHMIKQQKCQLILVGDSMQSIYAYRGAQNALERVRRPGMRTCFLTTSFRFGDDIAVRANVILGNLNASHPIKGVNIDRGQLKGPEAFLYRSNIGMFADVIHHFREGRKDFAIAGGTKDMVALLNGIDQLMLGKPSSHPDFTGFESWHQYRQAAEQDAAPADMQRLVKIVTHYPRRLLLAALRQGDERKKGQPAPAFMFSTAHKSKGREWPEVRLGQDFAAPDPSPHAALDRDEARLAYVAVTRAQRTLRGANELVRTYADRLRAIANHADEASKLEDLAESFRALSTAERKRHFNNLPKAQQEALLRHLRQRYEATP